MTDQLRSDGRVTRGGPNDTLPADDPVLLAWLKKILKPDVFDDDNVVLPREPMDGLIEMARDKGFVIYAQGG